MSDRIAQESRLTIDALVGVATSPALGKDHAYEIRLSCNAAGQSNCRIKAIATDVRFMEGNGGHMHLCRRVLGGAVTAATGHRCTTTAPPEHSFAHFRVGGGALERISAWVRHGETSQDVGLRIATCGVCRRRDGVSIAHLSVRCGSRFL